MANYLELGARILLDRMKSYAGVSITYRRGSNLYHLTAVPARVVTDQATDSGVVMREVSRDFIISVSDLKYLNPPHPQRGDEIVQLGDDESWVFIVTGEATATSHYEEADSYGKAWRVHTKRDYKRA